MDNGGINKGITDLKIMQLCLGIKADIAEVKTLVKMSMRKPSERMTEEWLDGLQVMKILKITRGTLQSYRDEGTLNYTTFHNKFYYKASYIEGLLKSNYKKRPRKGKKHQGTYY